MARNGYQPAAEPKEDAAYDADPGKTMEMRALTPPAVSDGGAQTGKKGGTAAGAATGYGVLSNGVATPAVAPAATAAWVPVDARSGGHVVWAGLAGTAVMTAVAYAAPPLFGMKPLTLPTMMGSMFLPHNSGGAFLLGMGIHFTTGVLLTAVFAGLLRAAHRQSNVGAGMAFGGVLWVISGSIMPFLMALHPLVRAGYMPNPGFFLHDLKPGGALPGLMDLLSHLVFGAVIGLLYKNRVQAAVSASPSAGTPTGNVAARPYL